MADKKLSDLVKTAIKISERYEEAEVKAIIHKIEKLINDQDCIFRGEPEEYDRPCSSQLYRDLAPDNLSSNQLEKFIKREQKQYANDLERYVPGRPQARDRLSELQHFGGRTNFIDFTTDYHIALFFACRNLDSDGRVIIKKKADYKEITKDSDLSVKDGIFRPLPTNNRVVRQASIFVSTTKGYVDIKDNDCILISKDLKASILHYLERYHDIKHDTVFDDLYGYIEEQKQFKVSELYFYLGLRFLNKRNYDKAIEYFDITDELDPESPLVYFYKGNAYNKQGNTDKAIADYTKAIKLDPNYADAYNNRGIVHRDIGNLDEALADFTKVIDLNARNTAE